MPGYTPQTALLVVDVQNDFADPPGSLYVGGGEEIVPVINREVEAALAGGAMVVYTQDWHPPATPHFQKDGGIWPVHCVQDSWGSAFHPDLSVAADAPVIRKGVGGEDGYSAFSVRDPSSGEASETALGALLEARGIRRTVVCGLTTDYCVVESVVDARARGLEAWVLTEAIRSVQLREGDEERALDRMRSAGAVLE